MKPDRPFPSDPQRESRPCPLKPGAILYLHCNFTTPPKSKYSIVVCTKPDLVVFLVNSRVNAWLAKRPALQNCQVTLCRDAHPFLHYDSFINCTQSHFLTADVIEQQLMNDRQRLKGYITPEEQRAIVCAQVKRLKNKSVVP